MSTVHISTFTVSASVDEEGGATAFATGADALQRYIEGLTATSCFVKAVDANHGCCFGTHDQSERASLNALLSQQFQVVLVDATRPATYYEKLTLRSSRARINQAAQPGTALATTAIAIVSSAVAASATETEVRQPYEVLFIDRVLVDDNDLKDAFASKDPIILKEKLAAEVVGFTTLSPFLDVARSGYRLKMIKPTDEALDTFTAKVSALMEELAPIFDTRRASIQERAAADAKVEQLKSSKKQLLGAARMGDFLEKYRANEKNARRCFGTMVRDEEEQQIEAGMASRQEIRASKLENASN